MTDLQLWVGPTFDRLADLLAAAPVETWDTPSLCDKWLVRHVIAHVTMPARRTPDQFGAEMTAARGDFTVLSESVAARDGSLPVADLLDQLRSSVLHAWQPPGGGAAGALSHAVIHSLDVTIALDRPAVAPAAATTTVLDQLTASNGSWFGTDLTGSGSRPVTATGAGEPGALFARTAARWWHSSAAARSPTVAHSPAADGPTGLSVCRKPRSCSSAQSPRPADDRW